MSPQEIPERYHFKENRRVPAVMATASLGWSIFTHVGVANSKNKFTGGDHGYDNDNPDMR